MKKSGLLIVLIFLTVVAGPPAVTGDGAATEARENAVEQAAVFLVDALTEAEARSPGLGEVIAAIQGRRGVCIHDRPGKPNRFPLMACSVGWGTFKEKVTSSRAILAPPETSITYTLKIPPGGRLELGGLAWDPAKEPKDGGNVIFEVRAGSPEVRKDNLLTVSVPVRTILVEEKEKGFLARRWSAIRKGAKEMEPPQTYIIDLSAYGGETIELTLITRPASPAGTNPLAAFWLNPVIVAPVKNKFPDTIVLALVDSMKHSDYEVLAAEQKGTFSLIKNGGAYFSEAYANGTWTRTSTISMLTSRSPLELGLPLGDYAVRWEAQKFFYSLGIENLPQILREKGILSAAFGDNIFISPTSELGVDMDFDEVYFIGGPGAASRAGVEALKWAAAKKGRPVFIYLHLPGAHSPRKPPLSSYLKLLVRHPSLFFSEPAVFASFLHNQEELGRFLAGMDRLGLADNSLFVLASDHGRPLGRTGLYGAKGVLSEEMLRVPLVFWGNGVVPGETVSQAVELMDIMPGVLQLAGIDRDGKRDGRVMSLINKQEDVPNRHFFAVGASPENRLSYVQKGKVTMVPTSIRDHAEKEIPRDYELYLLDFQVEEVPLRGELQSLGRGKITWAYGIGFGPGDRIIWNGRDRISFKISPGDGERQIIYRTVPAGARCRFKLYEEEKMLDASFVGLGPAALRPLKMPFNAGGRKGTGILRAPFYPAALDDGTLVDLYLVPYQRWLSGRTKETALSRPLRDLLNSWGY